MAVLDQSYQPWHGDFQPRFRRVVAMIQVEIKQAFAGTFTKIMLLSTFTLMFGIVGILFIVSSLPVDRTFDFLAGNHLFRFFLSSMFPTGVLIMTLAAMIGGRAVSRDLRTNAMSMYFSKAILPFDYLMAKWATVSLFLLSATFAPAALMWIGHWAVARESLTTGQRLADLGAVTLHSLVIVLPIAMYVLALSSLSRGAFVPAILWTLTYLGSWTISLILGEALGEDWCKLLSWPNLTNRLGELCYANRPLPLKVHKTDFMSGPSLPYDWQEPLTILAAVTVISAGIVLWRLRKFEGQE
ncbi:MAG: hypothetical protein HYY16_09095 [Planctomycetes bacterium]|nr:hypothetical protein [Planctomycetota bacterium]